MVKYLTTRPAKINSRVKQDFLMFVVSSGLYSFNTIISIWLTDLFYLNIRKQIVQILKTLKGSHISKKEGSTMFKVLLTLKSCISKHCSKLNFLFWIPAEGSHVMLRSQFQPVMQLIFSCNIMKTVVEFNAAIFNSIELKWE